MLTALGFAVAVSILATNKLHFETFGRLTDWLDRATPLRRVVARVPLLWNLACLALFAAATASAWFDAQGPLAASMGQLVALIWLDFGLSEISRAPATVAEARARCERTWVRWLAPALKDEGQIVLVRHIVDLLVVAGGLVVAMLVFAVRGLSAWALLLPALLLYVRANGFWQEIIHIDSHIRFMTPRRSTPRSLRRAAVTALGAASDWGLSQFFGMFPGWYVAEHVGNHHPEINSLDDVETLQRFDRTNFLHFAALAGRVIANTTTGHGMYGYLLARGRRKYFRIAVTGAAGHAICTGAALLVSPPLGVWMVLSSLGFGYSLAMIALSDHGLADPLDPTNMYRNSYNVLWDLDDHGQYGAKYHLTHHLSPTPTWGPRTAALARKHEATGCRENGSILFHNFAYPDDLLRAFWNDDADFLHPYVASVGSARPDLREWREVFGQRIRPIGARPADAAARWISRQMARLATFHIPPPAAPPAADRAN